MSVSLEKPNIFVSFFIFSLYFLSLLAGMTSIPAIGVTYSIYAHNRLPPSPEHVAAILQSLKITAVRLPESDPTVVRSFAYSNVSLLLNIPNTLIPAIASNRSNAFQWIYSHVIPFYPRAKITTISVGNNALDHSADLSGFLLPAIRNVHLALRDLGIQKISVSTTFSFINIMTTSFPPSAARFQEPASEAIMKPLLQFLHDTNSSFLINLFPYNVYKLRSEIPIGYALFQEHPFNFRDDLATGVRYRNLFDMMVDAVICAMAVAGHENIPVTVAETGWPSSSDTNDAEATKVYAEMYIKGLVKHLKSGLGTPLRKEGVVETYIYELFDRETTSQGTDSGSHWGIFYPNMTKKYTVDFSASDRTGGGRRGFVEMAGRFVLVVLAVLLLQ